MYLYSIHHPWLDCVCVLRVNRTIYEKLASAFTEEMAALYRQRVDEISPNIRYCAYNIGELSHTCESSIKGSYSNVPWTVKRDEKEVQS